MSVASISARSEPERAAWRARAGAASALVRRDWRITRSYRTALVSDLAFGFLNLVAYYYISKTLRPKLHVGLDGAPDYFAFAAVGVALTVVLQAAVVGVSRRLREEQLTGTLEALLVQPISSVEIAIGLTGFPFLFATVRAFAYLLLAAVFLGLSLAHCDWLGLTVAFVLSGVALSGIGIMLASLVLVFKRAESAGALAGFGLGLLGGAFFAVRVLPQFLQPVAAVLPTRYAFTAARDALFGRGAWVGAAATLALLAVGTLIIGLLMFDIALRHVVRRGTINQY